jgi:hypothetical protein
MSSITIKNRLQKELLQFRCTFHNVKESLNLFLALEATDITEANITFHCKIFPKGKVNEYCFRLAMSANPVKTPQPSCKMQVIVSCFNRNFESEVCPFTSSGFTHNITTPFYTRAELCSLPDNILNFHVQVTMVRLVETRQLVAVPSNNHKFISIASACCAMPFDCTIVVENEVIHSHKALLASSSLVFKEQLLTSCEVKVLPPHDAITVNLFLCYLLTAQLPDELDALLLVLTFAVRYDVAVLRAQCVQHLVYAHLSPDTVLSLLRFSTLYEGGTPQGPCGLQALKDACLGFIRFHAPEILQEAFVEDIVTSGLSKDVLLLFGEAPQEPQQQAS